jgi:hypothetical protein
LPGSCNYPVYSGVTFSTTHLALRDGGGSSIQSVSGVIQGLEVGPRANAETICFLFTSDSASCPQSRRIVPLDRDREAVSWIQHEVSTSRPAVPMAEVLLQNVSMTPTPFAGASQFELSCGTNRSQQLRRGAQQCLPHSTSKAHSHPANLGRR